MMKFVAEYVKGYDKCQQNKTIPQLLVGKLMPAETPTEPWKSVAVDFVTGLLEVNRVDALLVVVCQAKKQIHIIPTTKKTSALGLAKLYRDNVWRYHGLPDEMTSDRGPQFAADLMKELNTML